MNSLTLLSLVNSGACIVVDATQLNAMSLQGMATAAKTSGGKLIVKNAGQLNALTLQGLANAGKAHVELDFT